MEELWKSSHISAGHADYLESLYEIYLTDPENLSNEWQDFFNSLPSDSSNLKEVSHQTIISEFRNLPRNSSLLNEEIDERQGKVIRLIQAYRNRGHQEADRKSVV